MSLDDRDLQRIAERIARLLFPHIHDGSHAGAQQPVLQPQPKPVQSGLVDAATLARLLGVERGWVYAHAKQLGAVRLGGPRGRLRFDLARLGDRLDAGSPALSQRAAADLARRVERRPVQQRKHGLELRSIDENGRAARQRSRPDTGR